MDRRFAPAALIRLWNDQNVHALFHVRKMFFSRTPPEQIFACP
jgi:hypothetical protein